ncbi:MAG: DsrE family protein [Paralcaligenes sp.]
MIKKILTLILSVGLLGFASLTLADQTPRVVYHVNDAEHQALAALRNVRNQLDTVPSTKVVVVTHANGVDFLMTNYKDAAKVGPLVSALAARGVDFEVCEITLKNRNLKKDDFIMESNFTPSGVVLITKLQNEGYAYIRP